MTETTKSTPLTKNYHWDPEAKIEITGLEFNYFQRVLGLFEGSTIGRLTMEKAFQAKSEILKRMISSGIANEFEGETPPTTQPESPVNPEPEVQPEQLTKEMD